MHYKGFGRVVQLFCLLLLLCADGQEILAKKLQKRGIMDGFNEGIKYAGQMLGINTAADVANLVAKAFSTTSASTSRRRPDFMSIFQQRATEQQNDAEQAQQTAEQATSSEEAQQSGYSNERPAAQPAKQAGGFDLNTTNFISSVLRMIGFDASKLGALAINALIMIAQTIGNTLMSANKRKRVGAVSDDVGFEVNKQDTTPDALYADEHAHQPRDLPDDAPIDWFLRAPHANAAELKGLLSRATDANLSDQLLDMIERMELESGQGACLKLLMCKSTPFIWGMQKSLAGRYGSNATAAPAEEAAEQRLKAQTLFTHLPGLAEYRTNSAQCEQRFANYCNRTEFYKRHKHGNN